jgi:hypothetical protein
MEVVNRKEAFGGRPQPLQTGGTAMRPVQQLGLMFACAVMMATLLALPAAASSPDVVDPKTHRVQYQKLAAEWWQWVLSTPAEEDGPFDPGRVDCDQNQPSPKRVLFLVGPFNQSGSVKRTCQDPVTRGTKIFFPVINTECSNIEEPPFFGATPGQRRECVNEPHFNPSEPSATVDGRPIPNLDKHNIVSKDFAFIAVPNNPGIDVAEPTRGRSTTRGTWVLLRPLTKGPHTITFAGSYPVFDFSISVTYHLTVR